MAALAFSRVITGTVTFGSSDTAVTVNLPSPVDRSKTQVKISVSSNNTNTNWGSLLVEYWLPSGGATLELERAESGVTLAVTYQIVEFAAGLTVTWQRFTTGASWGTQYTETIASAPSGRRLLIPSYQRAQTNREGHYAAHWFRFASATGLEVNRGNGGASAETKCSVQIVVFDADSGVTVQEKDFSWSNAVTEAISISAVTVAQTSVYVTSGTNVFNVEDWSFAVQLEGLTSTVLTLRNNRNNSGVTISGTAFIVDWGAGVSVQRGRSTASGLTATTFTDSISAVTVANSIVYSSVGAFYFQHQGFPTGSSLWANRMMRPSLTGSTQLTFTRLLTNSAGQDQGWQVIDFTGILASEDDYKLEVDAAGLDLLAQDVSLFAARKIGIGVGNIGLHGVSIDLARGRKVGIDNAILDLTAFNVDLIYTPNSGAYTVTVDKVALSLLPQDIGLSAARKLGIINGAISAAGNGIGVGYGLKIRVDSAPINLHGLDVAFLQSRIIPADAATLHLLARDVRVVYSGQPIWTVVSRDATSWARQDKDELIWTIH